MGSFANTLFSVLLGWVKSAISWLWQLIGSEDVGGFMGWVLDGWNWLTVVIVLCAAGVLLDLVIYLIRWQPYRVWRSFLRRNEPEEDEAGWTEPEVLEERRWLYADGSVTVEPLVQPVEQPEEPTILSDAQELLLRSPVRPTRRVIPARRRRAADGSEEYLLPDLGGEQEAYHKPYYPPQWHTGEQQTIDEGDKA